MQIEIGSFHHWGECLCENYYAMKRARAEEGSKNKKLEIIVLRQMCADKAQGELYHRQRLKPEFTTALYGPAEARALIRTRGRAQRGWIAGVAGDQNGKIYHGGTETRRRTAAAERGASRRMEQGGACQEGQECDVSAGWFCQDGRILIL